MLAAFHRFEQERLALAADLAVGRERGLDVGQEPAGDRDQVALAASFRNSSREGEYMRDGGYWPKAGTFGIASLPKSARCDFAPEPLLAPGGPAHAPDGEQGIESDRAGVGHYAQPDRQRDQASSWLK